jgi:hypothetical protein
LDKKFTNQINLDLVQAVDFALLKDGKLIELHREKATSSW